METLDIETAHGTVTVELVRKRVKNLNLRVRRDGSVTLSAPLGTSRDTAAAMLERHRRWIEHRLAKATPAAHEPSILGRGTVTLWGEQVSLEAHVEHGRKRAVLARSAHGLVARLPKDMPLEAQEAEVERLVARLEAREVAAALPEVATRFEGLLGVHAARWSVRRMRTRWGSCTPSTGAIRINAALAAYPPACLDYVVAHELVHLLEPTHNARFHALLGGVLPEAAALRARLKQRA